MPSGNKKGLTHRKEIKPLCLHGSCQQERDSGSDYCEFHKKSHPAKATGYSPEMMRKMMAGSAAIRPRSYSDYKEAGR